MNYFSLFDLDEQYTLNTDALEQRFRILQKLTHPDKFANASDSEKRMYMQKNAQVNDAYYVLADDVARGEHLLTLRGLTLPSEQETIGDTSFLMEQMEFREALASADTLPEIEQLQRTVSESIADYIDKITILLNNNNEDDNHASGLLLNKLKFVKKLAGEVKSRKQFIEKL